MYLSNSFYGNRLGLITLIPSNFQIYLSKLTNIYICQGGKIFCQTVCMETDWVESTFISSNRQIYLYNWENVLAKKSVMKQIEFNHLDTIKSPNIFV